MIRTVFACAVAAGVLGFAAPVFGQAVVVREKPGTGQWWVSYTRMMDKDDTGGELSGAFATLAAARQHAAGLQKWSRSMEPPTTGWRLRTIFIEGEDSSASAKPKPDAAPKTQGLFAAVHDKIERDKQLQDSLKNLGVGKTETGKFAADLLADPAAAYAEKLGEKAKDMLSKRQGLTDYLKNVKDAYGRAKDAKDELMGLTGTLAEKRFGEVNALVDRYNKEAANAPAGLGAVGGLFPKMTPVGPGTVKGAAEWRDALGKQFELEAKKAKLDAARADLDRERADLTAAWKKLTDGGTDPDPADPKVISLRKRLAEYQEKATAYTTDLSVYRTGVERLRETAARLTPSGSGSDSLADAPAKVVGTWVNKINKDKITITGGARLML